MEPDLINTVGQELQHVVDLFFSSRRRHTRWTGDWSSDVCSSDLNLARALITPMISRLDLPAGTDLWPQVVIGLRRSRPVTAVAGSLLQKSYFFTASSEEIGRASCRERV